MEHIEVAVTTPGAATAIMVRGSETKVCADAGTAIRLVAKDGGIPLFAVHCNEPVTRLRVWAFLLGVFCEAAERG